MNISIIFGAVSVILTILFILWILNPREWLEPEPNNWHYIGIGKNPLWVIDGDTTPWFGSKIPIVWPFRIIPIKLKWQEWVEGISKAEEKIGNTIGGNTTDERKFKEVIKFPSSPTGFIGQRDEWVPSLRKLEYVSYYVQVNSKDGYDFTLIISFFLRTQEPMKVIKRPIFKMLGKDAVDTAVEPWGYGRDINEIKNTNVDLIKDPTCGISINGKNLVTYLDEKHFNKVGVWIDAPFLSILEGEDTKKYFKLRQEQKEEIQKGLNADTFFQTREKERKSEWEDAKQESEIAKMMEKAVLDPTTDFIKALYQGKKEVAGSYNYLLVKGDEDQTGNDALTELVKRMPKPGESTAARKFKKEEVPDEN